MKSHLNSEAHQKMVDSKKARAASSNTALGTSMFQITVMHAINNLRSAKDGCEEVIEEFLTAMIGAKIPLQTVDNDCFGQFVSKSVRNGESILKANVLRDKVPSLYEKHKLQLNQKYVNEPIIVMVDETTDDHAKQVANILFATCVKSYLTPIKPYLVDAIILEKTNTATIGDTVLHTSALYEVEYSNVVGFVSDGAKCMKLC